MGYKLESKVMDDSYAPSFIGGDTGRVVIGGDGKCEIWDVQTRSAVHVITDIKRSVNCTFSTGDILAVGSYGKVLSLYDINTWGVIYSKTYEMIPSSLHLT